MCGRYTRRANRQQLLASMQIGDTDESDDVLCAPSFNVAPQSFQPVVRLGPDGAERQLAGMRWGLVPFWSKDGKTTFSTINARSETIATSPLYRDAMKRRRCLVPADAFYEWKKLDEKKKQPFAIAMKDDSVFAFAGLWDSWHDPATGRALETFTIATTDPNPLMESIHNRMPVILRPQDYGRWLHPGDPARLPLDLLRPFDAGSMRAWKVGAAVGNVRNNNPSLIEQLP